MKKGPIFIVGMPRSGTKLLRTLLHNHSMIVFPDYEAEILPFFATYWERYGEPSDFASFQKFYNIIRKSSFFYYMERNTGGVISCKEWFSSCNNLSISEVFEKLIRFDTNCSGDIIWGDKSPSYVRHIPLLIDLYPYAKVIHLVRDVRDYCLSINKAWRKNILRAAQRWNDDTYKACNDIKKKSTSCIEVRFEDLLNNPQEILLDICIFLDISFENKMLHLSKSVEEVGDAKGETRIVSNNKEKWMKNMTPEYIREVEAICAAQLTYYRYPISCQPQVQKRLSRFRMGLYQLFDLWNFINADYDNRGILNNLYFKISTAFMSGLSIK